MLADLDESHDCWCNSGRVAGSVSSLEEVHGRVFDLDEGWLFITEKAFEEFDTLINGFVEASVITTADFMKCGFLFTSGMEVGKLGFDASLLVTVESKNALARSLSCFTCSKFAVGTVTGEFCVCDFSGTEFFLFITINLLLGSESVVFSLFGFDLISQIAKHGIDVFNWSTSLHHALNLC